MGQDQNSADSNRRQFLTGRALRNQLESAADVLSDQLTENPQDVPAGSSTLRLTTRAMACDFSVFVNPDAAPQLKHASDALDLLHPLEQLMTVYRDDSEMTRVNDQAFGTSIPVERSLFELLQRARTMSMETNRGFDPTMGPVIALWRSCRAGGQVPTQQEIDDCLSRTGIDQVRFDNQTASIGFDVEGMELNLGAIGKGYALDQISSHLAGQGLVDFLCHGGHSSIRAHGTHHGLPGWPIGLRNPLFTEQRLATVLLQDQAMGTSGSNVQYFRLQGRRFGHILDPRSGWPVEDILSCWVFAPTAEQADALSTAFFVIGVENARRYCDNHPKVSAILIPQPRQGRSLEPVICGVPDDVLFLTSADVTTSRTWPG
ncbi:MAG: FAD:protein FMN transferase [Planctomycetaceae bacterium]